MPRDSQGNYTLPPVINPVVPGTVIEAEWANPTLNDVAVAITDSLSRTGAGGMLGPFRFADGNRALPGNSWANEPTSGWYRAGLNDFRYAIGGEDIFIITKDGIAIAPTKNALNIAAFINIQDDVPANFSTGEQWFESDTGGLYMKYTNPDGSHTLVATSSIGGDFVPYQEKGQPSGVATLDAGGTIPPDQIPVLPIGSLPINVPDGLAGLDGDAQVMMAQLPGGEALGLATLDADGHVPLDQLSGVAVLDVNGKVPITQLPVGLANGVASLDGTIHVPSAQLPIGVPGGIATLDANGDVPSAQLPIGLANGVAGLDANAKVPLAQLPDMTLPDEALTEAEAAALYVPLAQRAAANGVATLDAGSKVPIAQIPPISIGLLPGELLTEAEAASIYIPLSQRGVASGVATLDSTTKVPNLQLHRGEANGVASLDASGVVPTAQLPPQPPVGVPGGVASLDGNGKVPMAQLYAGTMNGLATLDATGTVPVSQLPPEALTESEALANYVPLTQKGVANGVATLDASSFIPIGQIPTALLTEAEALLLYVPLSQVGVANGVASLGAGGTVPDAQIPAAIARDSEVTAAIAAHAAAADPHPAYLTAAEGNAAYEAAGAVAAHAAAADPHAGYQKESEKGAVNGYAALDAGGTVPDAQLPAGLARDTEVTAAVAAHAAAPDPHPGYLTSAEGNAAYEPVGAVAAHAALADPHTGYQKESEKNAANGYPGLDANTRLVLARLPLAASDGQFLVRRTGVMAYATLVDADIPATIARDTEVTAAVAAHAATPDAHPEYLTQAEGDAAYEALGAVAAHAGAADPHPGYLTAAEGNAAYEAAGAVAAHAAAADPHAGYQKESEKDAANGYPGLDANTRLVLARLPLASADGQFLVRRSGLTSYATLVDADIPATIARDTEVTSAISTHAAAADPHTGYQLESQKGAVNGYASLDSGGTVPDAQIPAAIARDSEVTAAITAHEAAANPHPTYLTAAEGNAAYEALGAVAAHAAAADPHAGYQKESERGAVNGYASLDAGGTVPDAQIPAAIARDSEVTAAIAAHAALADPHPGYLTAAEGNAAYIPLTQRGAANGVATLDASSLIPDAQIPATIARDTEITSAISTHAAAADPHTVYQKESEKAVANGYASLDATGKVPSAQLPATASTDDSIIYAVALG